MDLSPAQQDRITGTLVGLATGDALGAPAEFHSRAEVRQLFPHGMQYMRASATWAAGEYTDDTQMALILADSILLKGSLDPADVAPRFRFWATDAKDVGNQIRRVTAMPAYATDPVACATFDFARHPQNAAGNGAVMRCAPIALFHAFDPPRLIADSRLSALITHGDPKAATSCVLVNAAIAHFLHGGDRTDPWQHGMKLLTPGEQQPWHRLPGIEHVPESAIASNGYTVSSVEAAFWCFVRASSFAQAIELAASLGDDADTTAAIAGALAGAFYGQSAIPTLWTDRLMDRDHLADTALRLVRAGQPA